MIQDNYNSEDLVDIFGEFIDWEKRRKGENGFLTNMLTTNNCTNVFDCCLGDGVDSIHLLQNNFLVTSNDLDELFIKKAIENASKLNVNLKITSYDWRNLEQNILPETFDTTISQFMKKPILIFCILLLLWSASFAQIIVDKRIYKVNFSNSYHQPRFVSYYLYKGGGECNREKFSFKNDDPQLQCATDKDYDGSGYDKGHLANAEDFAFDCVSDELTFRYYNCLPQTPNLNRGPWKTNETLVRTWSQSEKLYIVCGGFFGNKTVSKMAVPSYCWKVVQSVATKKVLFCGWFSNSTKATMESIEISELERRLGAKIGLVK